MCVRMLLRRAEDMILARGCSVKPGECIQDRINTSGRKKKTRKGHDYQGVGECVVEDTRRQRWWKRVESVCLIWSHYDLIYKSLLYVTWNVHKTENFMRAAHMMTMKGARCMHGNHENSNLTPITRHVPKTTFLNMAGSIFFATCFPTRMPTIVVGRATVTKSI